MSKFKINSQVVLELSEQNISKSLFHILFDWVAIALIIYFTQLYLNPVTYILAVMLIGNRQHGLLILMHDSSHFRFSSNRKVNDIVGDVFTAWPLFIQMRAYREKHLAHHRYSNSEGDPDFVLARYPKFRGEVIKMLVMDLFALNTMAQFKQINGFQLKSSLAYKICRFAFYATALSSIVYFGGLKLFLMFWIVPAFTWLKVCLRLRSISDHTGLQHKEGPYDTRTIIPNLFDRLFLAPHLSSYHFGHHTFAAVPCYNLKKLHNEIMKSEDAHKIHITNGYFELFSEFPVNEADVERVEKEKNISFTLNMPKA
jgi:fatty acid desaturase